MKTKSAKAQQDKAAERPRRDTYQAVTDLIVGHLEQGVVPWRRPWNRAAGRPRNLASGRWYQGVNVLLLGLRQFASPYWLTLRQANELGGQVRKGEHGTPIVKYGRHEQRVKGQEEEEPRRRFFLRGYTVFNLTQVEGIQAPEEETAPRNPKAAIDAAEEIVAAMPAKPAIHEGRKVKACYHVTSDTVDVPDRRRFESVERFYATLFHELIHATGHESRLNRRCLMLAPAGAMEEYSKEELVAEMGAAFLAMEAGIVEDDHAQSAAYVQCWLTTLRDPQNKRWVIEAAGQAAKAANHVLMREQFSEA